MPNEIWVRLVFCLSWRLGTLNSWHSDRLFILSGAMSRRAEVFLSSCEIASMVFSLSFSLRYWCLHREGCSWALFSALCRINIYIFIEIKNLLLIERDSNIVHLCYVFCSCCPSLFDSNVKSTIHLKGEANEDC